MDFIKLFVDIFVCAYVSVCFMHNFNSKNTYFFHFIVLPDFDLTVAYLSVLGPSEFNGELFDFAWDLTKSLAVLFPEINVDFSLPIQTILFTASEIFMVKYFSLRRNTWNQSVYGSSMGF